MLAVELGPKAFVIAAKMAEKNWGLALPILPTSQATKCVLSCVRIIISSIMVAYG